MSEAPPLSEGRRVIYRHRNPPDLKLLEFQASARPGRRGRQTHDGAPSVRALSTGAQPPYRGLLIWQQPPGQETQIVSSSSSHRQRTVPTADTPWGMLM
jgi:hypothetical protein